MSYALTIGKQRQQKATTRQREVVAKSIAKIG